MEIVNHVSAFKSSHYFFDVIAESQQVKIASQKASE